MFTTRIEQIEIPPKEIERKGIFHWWRTEIEINVPWFIVDNGFRSTKDVHFPFQTMVTNNQELMKVVSGLGSVPYTVTVVLPRKRENSCGLRFITITEIWELYKQERSYKSFLGCVFIDEKGEMHSHQNEQEYLDVSTHIEKHFVMNVIPSSS